MIQSILVPMDGSEASFSALENAAELGRIAGAKLRGLFVEDEGEFLPPAYVAPVPEPFVPGLGTTGLPPAPSEELIQEWQLSGAKIQTAFAQQCELMNVKGNCAVVRGIAREVIVEQAKTADLVVMGRRGKRNSHRSKGPGSHTEAVLMTTTRPVLVVPAGTRRTGRILVAYDGSKAAQRAIDYGAIFTKLQVSKVDVLTVANTGAEAYGPQGEARKFLAAYDLDVSFVVKPGHPALAISQHAQEIDAGLIVMGAYGHSRLVEMVFGSTTSEVLEKARCPVLLAG
jgi:nucleotide-binding universal stress UspA family protein